MDFFRVCLSMFWPPLGVYLQVGANKQFVICCVLTVFGYIPGLLYGIYVILDVDD